ncbi:MAG: phosphatidate cytidylyltransferase [Caldilineaceae bacterium]
MATRIIVGLVALPLVILPIWFGGLWYALTVLAIALIGGYEFFTLLTTGGYHPSIPIGLLWLALLVFCGLQPGMPLLPTTLTAGFIITFFYAFFQLDTPINTWLATSIGALYLGVMMGQLLALRQLEYGMWWVGFGLLITWSNDTAAYFVGSTWGKHKLWPRLSPRKTWEGTVSGWLCAALMGALVVTLFPLPITLRTGILLGALGGVLGLLGDLAISVLKRQVGVKDSGRFFPGHGGMLDRLDSSLFVMPFIYQVALWLVHFQ